MTQNNIKILANPYRTLLQLLFQAIKIYTVARCTYKSYQNLPGIVNDATVDSNRRTSIATKGSVHDKLPDVKTGTMVDSNRSYHTTHTSSHCTTHTTTLYLSLLIHTSLYHALLHHASFYDIIPHYTTPHYTIPPLPSPHFSSPHHPGKKSTKESSPAYLAASNMYSHQETVLLLWAAYHLDKEKDKENDKEKDRDRMKNKIGKKLISLITVD